MRKVTTSCRSCAVHIEIETAATDLASGEYFLLPIGEEVRCPDCGRVHEGKTYMRAVEFEGEIKQVRLWQ